ncbi:hypothetical protein K435DRAFT_696481 [Dendrothele bispora CBS 962.96]|uniref:GRIP domain-containing protein n=1 Tax=Dendrothele bispora (strain CBS 962.96) TaxID=1314807 RepID=A0A4S8KWY5_DENBC|nr:hypothetical protein K435DRAFT_696481 [Dendrothele bispora CBS 962.96]
MAGTDSPSASPKSSKFISVDATRTSLDSEPGVTSAPVHVNGHQNAISHNSSDEEELDAVTKLQRELQHTREEKENLASQYNALLAKLTAMRTTLGNKLKQDAEELDRREQLIQQLNAQNDDLSLTIETLKEELIVSHEESERSARELDDMRNRALQENTQESLIRERELRETQMELERCRLERDEWERTALQEKTLSDDAKTSLETMARDLELEKEARERATIARDNETERANNLQSVLEDFQTAKEHELRQAVKDYDSQLTQVTQSLAEYKSRALTAELSLEESKTNTTRTQELEKEVKEKNLLIGKLRHEAVIINEHLMEALRRLRKNSSDSNVDRRLVTNVLLQFLTTPRADAKRFEMLTLLASILSWTDAEREKAGLQRALPTSNSSSSSSFWRRTSSGSDRNPQELQKTDETESFSRLWVEFLLTEAASGAGDSTLTPPRINPSNSVPNSPTGGTFSVPNTPPTKAAKRLPSFTSAAMASSPNLATTFSESGNPPPLPVPSKKGKEKEVLSG